MTKPAWQVTTTRAFRAMTSAALSLTAVACGWAGETTPPTVEVDGETLRGSRAGEQVVFKGIPFAAPPIGELRWRPPAPLRSRAGIQEAIEFSPPCAQHDLTGWYRSIAEDVGVDPETVADLGMSGGPPTEDCLYLNVWTNNWQASEPQPVMVWIHGGGNTAGSASEPGYDGANLARKGVVVVSINYRLGILGFLAHPALTAESPHRSSGNYGLLDQVAGLDWVQRNIAAFGGDPGRVTIFGESAGAADVIYLMSSPLAEGLFHRGISQSGGHHINSFHAIEELEVAGLRLASQLGIEGTEGAAEALRARTVEELFATAASSESGPEFDNPDPRLRAGPSTDGWVLQEAQALVFSNGRQHDVGLLLGANRDEIRVSRPEAGLDADGYHQRIRDGYDARFVDRALAVYPVPADGDLFVALDQQQTDVTFRCGTKFIARSMATVGSPAYLYHFTRVMPGPVGERLGVYHGLEIDYVFNNTQVRENWYLGFPVPYDGVDHALAETMSDYWVQFAATGDPNREGLPLWPAYEPAADLYQELGDVVATRSGLRAEECALYEDILATRIAGTTTSAFEGR